jgi:ribosomal protein S18 acetylase RimI-like enzyme
MSTIAPDPDLLPRTAVRRASPDDLGPVAATLAAAFEHDPVFAWCVPDATRRRAVLPAFFRTVADLVARHDETYVAGVTRRPVAGVVDGAALWVPPRQPAVPEAAAEDFQAALADIFAADAERMFEVVALLDEHHPHEAHRYLWFVGVDPSAQGSGIGTALLEPVLAAADRAGEAAYLDATSKDSRRLYERHGFEVVGELAVPGSPTMWPMWRAPRPA